MKGEESQITLVDGEDIVPKSNVERLVQRALRRVRKARRKIERRTASYEAAGDQG